MGGTATSLPRPFSRLGGIPGPAAMFWPLAALGIAILLHIDIAFNRAINWDEFYHYSQIHLLRAGAPLEPLQTLHARLFAWVTDLPGSAIDHFRIIRPIVLGCVIATAAAIHALAARFVGWRIALVCSLLYLTAGFVMQHGASFRADAMVAACLTVSLALAARARLGLPALAAIAFLCAFATLETIKVVLYAPAFLGIAWLRWSEARFDRATALRLLAIPVLAGGFFLLLFLWHSHSLGIVDTAPAQGAASAVVERSGRKMFSFGGLPYYIFILKAALMAMVFAAAIVLTPWLLLRDARPAAERVALAGLWAPILVLGFYHNTAPYFYVFILAPVAAACAPAAMWLVHRYTLRAVSLILAVSALAVWAIEDRSIQAKQRALIDGAHAIFPAPVAYFDVSAMLGDWPKANHFMTPWGQDGYLSGHIRSFSATMEERPVPLVIVNEPIFETLFSTRGPAPNFLPADAAALRDTYLPFWGPYRLAGKRVPADGKSHRAEFLVPGPYTVHDGPVRFDGRLFQTRDVVHVERGYHRLEAVSGSPARLIWGERLTPPRAPPPAPPYWANF